MLNIVLLAILAMAVPFIDPGSASMVMAKLNALILVPSALLSGALIYKLGDREPDLPLDINDES